MTGRPASSWLKPSHRKSWSVRHGCETQNEWTREAPGQGVGRAVVVGRRVTEKGGDIADGGETEPHDARVLRGIRELVERAPPERRAGGQEPDGGSRGVRVLPVGRRDGRGRILVALAHREARLSLVRGRRRVRQRPGRRRPVVDDELLERGPHEGTPVRVLRDGDGEGETAAPGRCGGVPAAPGQGVAQAHEEAVAGVGGRRWIVIHGRGVVQLDEGEDAAPVVELEEEPAVGLGGIDRPQDVDVRRVLDPTRTVARRLAEIRNHRVPGVVRIDFAIRLADQLLVRAHSAERRAAEGRGFDPSDLDPRDARLRRGAPQGARGEEGANPRERSGEDGTIERTPRCTMPASSGASGPGPRWPDAARPAQAVSRTVARTRRVGSSAVPASRPPGPPAHGRLGPASPEGRRPAASRSAKASGSSGHLGRAMRVNGTPEKTSGGAT